MERLPIELFLRCIAQLSINDKLNCLTVNKSWFNNIRKFGKLYEKVWIYDQNKFNDMCTFFQRYRELAQSVESLTLIEIGLNASRLLTLPSLFPNITEFSFIQQEFPIHKWNNEEIQREFLTWSPKLKFVQELGTPIITPALFEATKNKLPELVSLHLSFLGYEDEELKLKFVSYLDKAPQLTVLRMQWLNIAVEHIQVLHSKAPHLKALSFDNCGFIPHTRQLKILNDPVESLETLSIENCTFSLKEDNWIDYFAKHYKNLKNIIMTYCEDDNDFTDSYWTQRDLRFKELMIQCPKLEYIHIHAFEVPEEMFMAMDESGLQLKKINLGIYNPYRDFTWLLKTTQIQTIESLSLSGVSWSSLIFLDKQDGFLKKLAMFPNLKHLRINQSREEVDSPESNHLDLDSLLNALKNLESLAVDFTTIRYHQRQETPYDTKLKKLVLEECYVESPLFTDNEEALRYLQDTLLPKTEFVLRELDDESPNEEYRDLFEYSYYCNKE